MVETRDSLKELIIMAIDLLKTKIDLDAVVLFGSYAGGYPSESCDIDLAIFSKDIANMDLEIRAKIFAEIQLKCGYKIEIHFFSSSDYEEARPTNFTGLILSTGRHYLRNRKLVA